jgi:hypothetical protein
LAPLTITEAKGTGAPFTSVIIPVICLVWLKTNNGVYIIISHTSSSFVFIIKILAVYKINLRQIDFQF